MFPFLQTYTLLYPIGFRTFVGYMYLEHSHNNSVLRVFLWLAVRGSQREKSGQTSLLANGNIQSSVFSKDGNTYRNTGQ